ncbi:MAG: Nramp family divalent metal transporter [bacterium]
MSRLPTILFWSVISAAFIGPGTVTTAASAGSKFGFALLWALVFSTVATLVLQEASGRLTIVSGLNLGQAIRRQFHGGLQGMLVLALVLGGIIFGCAAYQAGNVLGGVAGAVLGTHWPPVVLTCLLCGAAGLLLWLGTVRTVAYFLSAIVAFMGLAFLVTAFILEPPVGAILRGSLVPDLPHGSGLLVLGLIGTTVVPYNLFLGSGMAAGQRVQELRLGLSVSVMFGGIISMGVLVVGTAVDSFSYGSLATTLATNLGAGAGLLFAFGLCAAGFSSAITAPLAAAITARSLFAAGGGHAWQERDWRYRSVWLGVLIVGGAFGVAEVKPIPAIILAQALNGILLPLVAVFLLLAVNDGKLMRTDHLNGRLSNFLMSVVVAVTVVLGVSNLLRAASAATHLFAPKESLILTISTLVTLVLAVPLLRAVRSRRDFHGSHKLNT